MNTANVGELLDDVQCHDHLDRRAVRVSDDPSRAYESIGSIDLGYDEGDVLLHTEGAGVIDHHSTMAGDIFRIFEGDTSTCRDEGDIYISEVIPMAKLTDGVFLATEGD